MISTASAACSCLGFVVKLVQTCVYCFDGAQCFSSSNLFTALPVAAFFRFVVFSFMHEHAMKRKASSCTVERIVRNSYSWNGMAVTLYTSSFTPQAISTDADSQDDIRCCHQNCCAYVSVSQCPLNTYCDGDSARLPRREIGGCPAALRVYCFSSS